MTGLLCRRSQWLLLLVGVGCGSDPGSANSPASGSGSSAVAGNAGSSRGDTPKGGEAGDSVSGVAAWGGASGTTRGGAASGGSDTTSAVVTGGAGGVTTEGVAGAAGSSVDLSPQQTGDMGRAEDPSVVFWSSKYYLAWADWMGSVFVRRSSKVQTLLTDESFTWHLGDWNTEAPGLGVVRDPRDGQEKLAVYVTSATPFPGTIRVFLTADPGAACPGVGCEDMGTLANVAGYDGEYIAHPNGKQYLVFSTFAQLQIIELSDPWTTVDKPVQIAAVIPHSWEAGPDGVNGLNEAPAHAFSGDVLNLVYSLHNWQGTGSDAYNDGLLTIAVSGDPLDASQWHKKLDGPSFQGANGLNDPGSGALVSDGQVWWWIYGGFWGAVGDGPRHLRGQTVSFDAGGVVQLGTPR
jgi:hypothetical protein